MKTALYIFAAFCLLARCATAQEIDLGWVALFGPQYVAETGDTNYTPSSVFAWDKTRLSAPPEVDRVAYTSGWSSTVTNGVEIFWRTHLSPYDPAGDAARREAAIAAQAQAAARYEAAATATRAAQAALVANPNSVPAMRALLAALVEQVEALKGAQ